MSKTIPFFDLFSDYIPERELRILLLEVLIEEAAIDKEALTMSDRVLIMNKGRVAQYATPGEIVHAPASQFIKDFILRQLTIKRDNIYALFDASREGSSRDRNHCAACCCAALLLVEGA